MRAYFFVVEWLVSNGYVAVLDGNQVDKDRRIGSKELADKLGVKYYLLKITTRKSLKSRKNFRNKIKNWLGEISAVFD